MSLAHMVVENQQLDLRNIVETRFEPVEDMDAIHRLKDGSYVYEENLVDWDDDTGKTKVFRTYYLSNRANFAAFEDMSSWEDKSDEESNLYYEDLEAYEYPQESFCHFGGAA